MNNFEKFMIQLRTEFEERQKSKKSVHSQASVDAEIKLQKRDDLDHGKRLRENYEQNGQAMQKRVKIESIQTVQKEQKNEDIEKMPQKSIRQKTGYQVISKSSASQNFNRLQCNYYSLFKCLCGKQEKGSFHLFLHIKREHMHQNLAEVLLERIQRKIQNNQYLSLQELGIKQEMDLFDYSEALVAVSRNFSQFKGPAFLPPPINKGTYADMANIFLSQTANRPHEKKMLVSFFGYLRKYVQIYFGARHWQNQVPGILPRSSNSIIVFYDATCKKYGIKCPLSQDDVRQILYVLFKWMLDNRWTNHRVFRVNESVQLNDTIQVKSQAGDLNYNILDDFQEEQLKKLTKEADENRSEPELTYFDFRRHK